MRRLLLWAGVTLGILMFAGLHGCSEDDNPEAPPVTQTEFELLTEYMTANSLDLPDLLDGWIVSASTVMDAGLGSYFFIDLRSQADFDAGHIEGAMNTTLSEVVTFEDANNTAGLPVVVVCYTGQTAGHAVLALRVMGEDAQVLKWGMAGWHSDFAAKWTDNTGTVAYGYTGAWSSTGAPPAWGSFSDPDIATGLATGAAILQTQITGHVLDGFNGITIETALTDYEDYQFINYWAREDWDQYGHITGAYQVGPDSLNLATLAMLDPDKPIVVYCWSGQTASVIAGWLCLLGYDAYDLKFGANGMIYSELTESKWSPPLVDNPYETSGGEFGILVSYLEANDFDLPALLADAFVTATHIHLDVGLESYFIMDIRSAADFDTLGHIPGARNTPLADVLTYEDTYNKPPKPVVVVCYTGHSAGHAVMALRLLGVEAYVLKWGMASWDSRFAAAWTNNTSTDAYGYTGAWSTTGAPPALGTYAYPVIETGHTEGNVILEHQITNRILDEFNGLPMATVLTDYDEYHVINYWSEEHWTQYGHITGAYQITPDELTLDTLSALDPSKDNVIYCWSGQQASLIAAWLNLLGYDAYDLEFGANGMIYADLESNNWTTSIPAGFDYDTGSGD